MKIAIQIIITTIVLDTAHASDTNRVRVKRRLNQFGTMVRLMTGHNPLDFNGYGNYCGFGGHGKPVDKIDRCCMLHDWCYRDINRNECESILHTEPYIRMYRFESQGKNVTCRDPEICPRAVCECDKAVSECFAQNLNEYNDKMKTVMGRFISKTAKKLNVTP
ncbi:hypothetical protein ACJMK2_035510 [Sinanodonta woodiana]|uniref:Phospholipase A2 n=1 Tax=Sinanodonta woodiana TaxID=1069815 RepID=A0ABD3WV62_SINWO